jgi:hypothetical protein
VPGPGDLRTVRTLRRQRSGGAVPPAVCGDASSVDSCHDLDRDEREDEDRRPSEIPRPSHDVDAAVPL